MKSNFYGEKYLVRLLCCQIGVSLGSGHGKHFLRLLQIVGMKVG